MDDDENENNNNSAWLVLETDRNQIRPTKCVNYFLSSHAVDKFETDLLIFFPIIAEEA